MATLRLATARIVRNPVRPQRWDASIRAGDDFKLALTVYADDAGTPASVDGAAAQILLWPDPSHGPFSYDYGLGWLTGGTPIGAPGWVVRTIMGYPTPMRAGGINFFLAAPDTAALRVGRYRLVLQVDLPGGAYSQVEGILQVRATWGFGLVPGVTSIFQLDVSQLDRAALAAGLVNGLPVDADGFFLLGGAAAANASAVLGSAVLGNMVLGTGPANAGGGVSSGGGSVSYNSGNTISSGGNTISSGGNTISSGGGNTAPGVAGYSATLGSAVLGSMVLGNGPSNAGSGGSAGSSSGSGGSAGGGNSTFTIAGGKIYTPAGAVFKAKGINITDSSLGSASTILRQFPGLTFVRVACYSYQAPAAYSAFITAMTNAGVVVAIENHQNFNQDGSSAGNSGGGQGYCNTGPILATEVAWYQALATAYKSNSYLWFMTTNEPAVNPSVAALSAWHDALIGGIRSTGNNNPIGVDVNNPNTWGTSGGMTASVYAKYHNLWLDPHFYGWLWTDGGPIGGGGYSTNAVTVSLQMQSAIATLQTLHSADVVMPCIVGEYGNSTAGPTLDANGALNVAQTQLLSGAYTSGCAAWLWDYLGAGFQDQLQDGSGGLSSYGAEVAAWIASA